MGIQDYLFYSLLGLATVFVALILLMIIVVVLAAVTKEKEAPACVAADPCEVAVPERKLAPGTAGDIKLYDTDPRDAAMVMAIVADTLGKPLNELRFISIREVK